MTFADVDSDKFTDIITVNGGEIELHLFDNYYKKFVHAHTIDVPGCSQIHNIVVGRSSSYLRLFVTCASGMVHFVDRESISKEAGLEDFVWVVSETYLTIDAGSQPFITDLNGDYLEDIMFNQPGSSDIMIAFQVPGDPSALHVTSFNDALVADDSDCISPFDAKQLSIPHAVAMLDFDGDCMSDLFLTTEHAGEHFYEIYIRRERGRTADVVDNAGRKLRPTAQAPVAPHPAP